MELWPGNKNQRIWMKVIIQKRSNRRFLTPNGQWTNARERARNFNKSIIALQFCLERELYDVWIVLTFLELERDFHLDPFREMTSSKPALRKQIFNPT
jgi:hypothetical protein